jgi:UDP-3-O-[3-hydroxymyristoyl] glucosamine N-acyltransferase
MTYTVALLAEAVGGILVGDGSRPVVRVATPAAAGPQDLIYIDSARHLAELRASGAGSAVVPRDVLPPPGMSGIQVDRPASAIARILELLVPSARAFHQVSPQAVVDAGAVVAPDAGVGPFVYIGPGARIGRRTEVHPGSTIGRGVTIGDDCIIYSGVHIYPETVIGDRVVLHSGVVLGADGFGFVQEPAPGGAPGVCHRKVPHVGRVVIEDDVEIGANTAIDRAMLEDTRIGAGTKIDDLVMIGHNCQIGRHCIVVGQAGISGSSTVGDEATIAGQAGLADHVRIGRRATVGAQAGVTKNVADEGVVLGSPAMPVRNARRALPLIERLPEIRKQLAAHEGRLERLERAPNLER